MISFPGFLFSPSLVSISRLYSQANHSSRYLYRNQRTWPGDRGCFINEFCWYFPLWECGWWKEKPLMRKHTISIDGPTLPLIPCFVRFSLFQKDWVGLNVIFYSPNHRPEWKLYEAVCQYFRHKLMLEFLADTETWQREKILKIYLKLKIVTFCVFESKNQKLRRVYL